MLARIKVWLHNRAIPFNMTIDDDLVYISFYNHKFQFQYYFDSQLDLRTSFLQYKTDFVI